MRHLKLALRTLFKTPFVTVVAIVSLALGIGANAAIFSLFDQMLLKPLPAQAPRDLVNLSAPGPKPGSQSCNQAGDCDAVFSYAMFRDLEREQPVFTGIAAHRAFGANLSYQGQTTSNEGMLVSGSYFPVLGLVPAAGRLLGSQDDQAIGQSQVVVLSHEYWRRRFNEDPAIINDTMIVNGQSMTVVGVAPEGFTGTTLGSRPSVFVPITLRGLMQPGFVREAYNGFEDRRSYWAYLFARLQPGVSLEQASTGLNGPYRNIVNELEAPLQTGMSDQTMEQFRAKQVLVEEGYRGQSNLHAGARTPLLLLLTVTGVVLLIACANIAGLLLVRATGRATEFAVRASLGGGRRHLVQQLMTESLVLSLLGGACGLLLAVWATAAFVAMAPASIPRLAEVGIDRRAVLFTLVVATATAMMVGVAPARRAWKTDLNYALKGARGGGGKDSRLRSSFAVVQLSLALILLFGAGLLTRSFARLMDWNPGFERSHVVTTWMLPPGNPAGLRGTVSLMQRVRDEVAGLPGIRAAGLGSAGPLFGGVEVDGLAIEGRPAFAPDQMPTVQWFDIDPHYLDALGIRIVRGRSLEAADTAGAAPVALINETLARRFFPSENPIGRRLTVEDHPAEIVGVVADVTPLRPDEPTPPQVYWPIQQYQRGAAYLVLRTTPGIAGIEQSVGARVAAVDPGIQLGPFVTLDERFARTLVSPRFNMLLVASFALVAVLLSAVGVYGVTAHAVASRTPEFGVRVALGASPRQLVTSVIGRGMALTAIGIAAGCAGAMAVGRLLTSLLYGLPASDPATLVSAAALLTAVAALACWVPARRASRVDPVAALRAQ